MNHFIVYYMHLNIISVSQSCAHIHYIYQIKALDEKIPINIQYEKVVKSVADFTLGAIQHFVYRLTLTLLFFWGNNKTSQ